MPGSGGPILPPGPETFYGSIEDVLNLVRALLNDTQNSGAGLIFQDSKPFVIPLLNASTVELQRRLQNKSVPKQIGDVFIYNIPPINSLSAGVGAPNVSSYQSLSWTGFFDGFQTTTSPFLPPDLIIPLTIRQRQSGTGLPFTDLNQATEGLPSIYQNFSLGQWEWRMDAIYWNGCLTMQDVEIRYDQAPIYYPYALNPAAFPTTAIPFRDGVEALAYLIVEKFTSSRLPPGGSNPWTAKSDAIIQDLSMRYVRAKQNQVHYRQGFGDEGGTWWGGGGWF